MVAIVKPNEYRNGYNLDFLKINICRKLFHFVFLQIKNEHTIKIKKYIPGEKSILTPKNKNLELITFFEKKDQRCPLS